VICCGIAVQGAVINVSSVGAVIPATGFQAYGVAKAAQDKMTQNLALEFAPKGVRVNSILPGKAALQGRCRVTVCHKGGQVESYPAR
jgi:NAD(P)-dependent dehydrogenase (short-subunit alcohol dehydrogenase family)